MSLQCDSLSGELQDQWSSSIYQGTTNISTVTPVQRSGSGRVQIGLHSHLIVSLSFSLPYMYLHFAAL